MRRLPEKAERRHGGLNTVLESFLVHYIVVMRRLHEKAERRPEFQACLTVLRNGAQPGSQSVSVMRVYS